MIIQLKLVRTGMNFPDIAKQMAFATANAINRTLDEAQVVQRDHIRQVFTLRGNGGQYVLRMVTIKAEDRARKTNLVGRIRVGAPATDLRTDIGVDAGKSWILIKHEKGGTFTRTIGATGDVIAAVRSMFYIPADVARPTPDTIIPRNLYPAALGLAPRRAVDGGTIQERARLTKHARGPDTIQLQGKRRTFVITERGTGRPLGIYQREGKGRDNVSPVWFFTSKITVPPRLQFEATTTRVAAERFPVNLRGMLTYALKTAK